MATQIWLVRGPGRVGIAEIRRRYIKHWWRKYHPTGIELLETGPASMGSVVGGAFIGNFLVGPLGALVGGMAGGKNARTTFFVRTAEGPTLTCQCRAANFAGVHTLLSDMIERGRSASAPGVRGSGWFRRLAVIGLVVLGAIVVLAGIASLAGW